MINLKCPWTKSRLGLFLLAFVSGLGASVQAKAETKFIQNLFAVDSVASRIMEEPEYVEVCFLELKDASGENRHYVEGKSRKMPGDLAVFLLVLFTSDENYRWNMTSACMPKYNVRYKFWRENHTVAIDVCYGCKQVLFACDGKPFESAQFGEGAERTLQALEREFSNKEFRDLKEQLDKARRENLDHQIQIYKAILEERRHSKK